MHRLDVADDGVCVDCVEYIAIVASRFRMIASVGIIATRGRESIVVALQCVQTGFTVDDGTGWHAVQTEKTNPVAAGTGQNPNRAGRSGSQTGLFNAAPGVWQPGCRLAVRCGLPKDSREVFWIHAPDQAAGAGRSQAVRCESHMARGRMCRRHWGNPCDGIVSRVLRSR